MQEMMQHIDVGIIVAADRFTPYMWECAKKEMNRCDVFMVSTRGGGGGYIDDTRWNEPTARWSDTRYHRLAARWVDTFDEADAYTAVGHNDPVRCKK